MNEKEIILAIIQIIPILLIWMRLERRLSRLEGRFDMFCALVLKSLADNGTRH